MGSTVKKLSLDELELGMIIVRSDRPGVAFDEYGIPLTNLGKLSRLKDGGVKNVYIWVEAEEKEQPTKTTPQPKTPTIAKDDAVAVKPEPSAVTSKPNVATQPSITAVNLPQLATIPEAPTNTEDEVVTPKFIMATEILEKSKSVVFSSFEAIKKGRKLDVQTLTDIVADIAKTTTESPGIFTNMVRLQQMGEEEYLHGINVAIISLSVGQTMGVKGRELINLGMAGLLHDIGKSRVPERVMNRRMRLNNQEFHIMRKHPEWGEQILSRNNEISHDIALAVMRHHERADGSGYPNGLTTSYISRIAMIIGMAEDYDTMIGGGAESYPILHNTEAVRRIYAGMGTKFLEEYVKAFIKTMGIFPVGSLVRLVDSQLAIVCELNHNDPLRPKVISFGINGLSAPAFLNLSRIKGLKIEAAISQSEFPVDPKKIMDNFMKERVYSQKNNQILS